jgi:hypothetical protein
VNAGGPRSGIPDYLGRVLDPDGEAVGTCFQVASGVIVTAAHVLADAGADRAGAMASIDPPGGGGGREAKVIRVEELFDLAVLTTPEPLGAAWWAWWPAMPWPLEPRWW